MNERHTTLAATSAIILAGGQSSRLGQDKRRLRLWGASGPTLLEHTVQLATALCDEVLVVLNDPQEWPTLPARIIPDAIPGAGPLSGIVAGMAAATRPWGLVLACDMPFLSRDLLQHMLSRPRNFDALVPRSRAARNAAQLEPLHALYDITRCLPAARQTLHDGRRQVARMLDGLRVTVMEPDELRQFDPQDMALESLNTRDDLQRLAAVSERQAL